LHHHHSIKEGQMTASAPEPASSPKVKDLSSLGDYITGLWKVGGLPLVMVGLGAGNLFLPTTAAYTGNDQVLITVHIRRSHLGYVDHPRIQALASSTPPGDRARHQGHRAGWQTRRECFI
jgi:hypothetical protein